MRRVCCFCETWGSGGIEGFLFNTLTHMNLTDLHIEIVAVRQGDSVFTAPLAEIGIPVIELSDSLRSPKNAHLFRRFLADRSYDVIHFNLFHGLSLHYVEIARQMGVPVRIVHSHGSGLRKSFTRPAKLFLHHLGRFLWLNSATNLWCCSTPAACFLFDHRAATAQKIPNGIDVDRFRFSPDARTTVRQKLGWTDETVIGTVGRLSDEKNQSFLLDVFAAFCSLRPHSRLLIVGDGPEKANLAKKAAALGIADRTVFFGSTDQVGSLLSAMDLFVLPSLFEGFGIAAIEAQASGLPLLCSDGVPSETCLTASCTRLPLKSGAQRWAQVIAPLLSASPRHDGPDIVRNAGFDASSAAHLVEKIYREIAL
ncbi:MAG: glycosyltransferase [Oscillospiraceae bacterium]|nr:glycosyltransferase [Oscillospiraceae bacterium]